MNSRKWRAMVQADLAPVTALSHAIHGEYAEEIAVYAERLALYPAGCFVFERDGQVQGLLASHPWHRGAPPALGQMLGVLPPAADTYYLHDIALQPAARGQGAGAAGLDLVIDAARRAGMPDITLVAVNGADRYWATKGFDYVAGGSGYGPGTHVMRLAAA